MPKSFWRRKKRKKACERYQNFSEQEKDERHQYERERHKIPS